MTITITNQAAKYLKKIPPLLTKQIVTSIKNLVINPRPLNSKKLSGQENYRIRIGVYRIIYFINEKENSIDILRIAHRKEAYR